jgi:phosphoribosyl-ATP pyrophosphohydrolase/phosphoribosyl-AMP cyclohydrolase
MAEIAKKFTGSIYLKDLKAVAGINSGDIVSDDPAAYAAKMSDSNVDEIIVFDLSVSGDDKAHDAALDMIKDICKASDVPVTGAGNVKRMEDIKKLLYAGCKKAALNFSKEGNIEILKEVSEKFGKEKIVICYSDTEVLNRQTDLLDQFAGELISFAKTDSEIIKPDIDLPITLLTGSEYAKKEPAEVYEKYPFISALSGCIVNDNLSRIDDFKQTCVNRGFKICALEPAFTWDQLKKNNDGMVPVIVQDYRTDQVLMLAYMNEEAYNKTLQTGKMTYFSRSRNSLWLKGETSSHFQYVKSLTADCDLDTILARVKQVGAACHTGSYSCFFNEIAKKDYSEKNPQKVLDSVYEVIKDRKQHPREGSYTNYLYEKGIDKILKKVGEEATEMVIAAKNPNDNEVIYEMSDFLYHMMVLMAVKNVSWEDITDELSRR